MSDRDELAALIAAKLDGDRPEGWHASPCTQDEELADAILARWRLVPVEQAKPRWFCPDCQEVQPQGHQHWPHGLDNT